MAEVIHRYVGKDGKLSTTEQKEREVSNARLQAAKAREREGIATLRETELARRREELMETAVFTREAQDVAVVIRSRMLLLSRQEARKCVGKTEHEIQMIFDAAIREALTELGRFEAYATNTRRRKRNKRSEAAPGR